MHATAVLIYKLVAGHLLDDKLSMETVFTSGFLAVLKAWSLCGLKYPEINVLGHMLLTRMTTDAAVRTCDKALDASGKQRKFFAIQQLAKMFGEQSIFAGELVCTLSHHVLIALPELGGALQLVKLLKHLRPST